MDTIKFIVANPGGNITIFVLSPCENKDYQAIAKQLLALPEYRGEQVGFIKAMGEHNRLEMCGMEFCGNAGRSFALYCAKQQGLTGKQLITIEESGAVEPLTVEVDVDKAYTKIQMPKPISVAQKEDMTLVDLNGIVHLVLKDVEPSDRIFEKLKNNFYATANPPAFGVMFYNSAEQSMVPIVYVDAVRTTYWEGSCGSGSIACAAVLSKQEDTGTFSYPLKQPAGTIVATVEKQGGQLIANYIEGEVSFSPEYEITLK